MASSLSMTRAEREAFLEGVHIAVLALGNAAGAPILTPVWYSYSAGGDVRIVIGKDGKKGKLVQSGQRISLCVQTESPPYKYVTVEGPVSVETPDWERDTRAVAERYLGAAGAKSYLAGSSKEASETNNLLLRVTPDTWRTVDYGKA